MKPSEEIYKNMEKHAIVGGKIEHLVGSTFQVIGKILDEQAKAIFEMQEAQQFLLEKANGNTIVQDFYEWKKNKNV